MTLPFPDSPSMDENIVDSIQRIEQNIEYLDGNLTSRSSKLNTSTRDLTAASGDVTYIATGITPKCIIIFAQVGTSVISWGFIDEDGLEYCVYRDYAGVFSVDTSSCINLTTALGKSQTAVWKSYSSGSFVLTWTKTSTPTGTANLIFLALS